MMNLYCMNLDLKERCNAIISCLQRGNLLMQFESRFYTSREMYKEYVNKILCRKIIAEGVHRDLRAGCETCRGKAGSFDRISSDYWYIPYENVQCTYVHEAEWNNVCRNEI